MSTCIKDLFDYNLVKVRSKCDIIQLKINFHKDNCRKDGLTLWCKSCYKFYYNQNIEHFKKYHYDTRKRKLEYMKKI